LYYRLEGDMFQGSDKDIVDFMNGPKARIGQLPNSNTAFALVQIKPNGDMKVIGSMDFFDTLKRDNDGFVKKPFSHIQINDMAADPQTLNVYESMKEKYKSLPPTMEAFFFCSTL